MIRIFAPDDPLVRNGTYDVYGFTPAERRTYERRHGPVRATKGQPMRFFDVDDVPCYLDAVSFRAEKTSDGEMTVADLSLRVQPLEPDLAEALDPELAAELFVGTPPIVNPKIGALTWRVPKTKQHLDCCLLEADGERIGAYHFADAEVADVKARLEKGVEGFALTFYATVGSLGREDLEYLVLRWLRQQRLVTFRERQGDLLTAGASDDDETPDRPTRRRRGVLRGNPSPEAQL